MFTDNKNWWLRRPHILRFDYAYTAEYSDEGEFVCYFEPSNIVLNYEWITDNYVDWETFCDSLDVPAYPDEEDLQEYWRGYFKPFDIRPFSVNMYDTSSEMIGTAVNPNYV